MKRYREPGTPTNLKSDVQAKEAFCETLRLRGFSEVRVTMAPADIRATKDGKEYLFEIKFTRATNRYFGAATLTEWVAALEYSNRFRFVIAWQVDAAWSFEEYTVEEFMAHSYVPPFKVYFNVPVGPKVPFKARASRTIRLTHERILAMRNLFMSLRGDTHE